jgi:hypothetical protein
VHEQRVLITGLCTERKSDMHRQPVHYGVHGGECWLVRILHSYLRVWLFGVHSHRKLLLKVGL